MGASFGKEDIVQYAKNTYGTEPERLWAKFPDYAVLRRADSGKWYAVLMDIPRDRLGLSGMGNASIMNVKCDPAMVGSLRGKAGYFPAYHMNKANWVTVLLEGQVCQDEILYLLDCSYGLTAK